MSFIEFAASHGVMIDPARLDESGRIRRCGTEAHPRSKNGAYSWDGQRGWVMSWDGQAETQWYRDPNAKPWTDQERAAYAERMRAERERRRQIQAMAAHTAHQMILAATPEESHPYLRSKGLSMCRGFVLPDCALFVPMRDVGSGLLLGGQTIAWSQDSLAFEKKMIFGTRADGAVFRVGHRKPSVTVLCEGYATALSIDQACRIGSLSAQVVACFSAGNLERVAPFFPGAIVYADNDIKSKRGEQAAMATGLRWCMSDVPGHDANDDFQMDGGKFKVLSLVLDALESKVKEGASGIR